MNRFVRTQCESSTVVSAHGLGRPNPALQPLIFPRTAVMKAASSEPGRQRGFEGCHGNAAFGAETAPPMATRCAAAARADASEGLREGVSTMEYGLLYAPARPRGLALAALTAAV